MSRLRNKLSANTEAINQLRGGETDLPDPSIENITTDENSQDFLIAKQLDDEANTLKQISVKIAEMRMEHEREEHALRKEHLGFLSKITIYWLGLITAVSCFQGFSGIFPFETSFLKFFLQQKKFILSDTSFIALITTTTATILGLYTIAAIWLYKGKQEDQKHKAGTENSSDADK